MARRTPAEWEPQSAVQFTFPHPHGDWGPSYEEVRSCFVKLIEIAVSFQPVLLVCHHLAGVQKYFSEDLRVRLLFYEIASNDSWARDHGGIVIYEDSEPILLDFMFNGWGLKFPADRDNQVTTRLFERGAFRVNRLERPGLVLEGGSIDFDGLGTALTTSRCLCSPNRNPHLDRAGIEERLCSIFGLQQLLWLDYGQLQGDDTDAHIDTLARFCDPATIAYVQCSDPTDPHYDGLQRMEAQLRTFRQGSGEPYRLIPLPLPKALFNTAGDRLPATYANFLIVNGGVLVPTYGVPEDESALRVLRHAFPDRRVVGVPCRPLLSQGGSLHCVSMQYPAGTIAGVNQKMENHA